MSFVHAALVGSALLGCHSPGGVSAPPQATATNELQRTDPRAAGDSARQSVLSIPRAPDAVGSVYKVNLTFHGISALITFETPNGRIVTGVSEPADSAAPRQPASEDVCDCPESQVWADTVASGTGTITVQAKEGGTLHLGVAIYGRSAEQSRSWSSGGIRLRAGETRKLRLHIPGAAQGDSLWVEPAP